MAFTREAGVAEAAGLLLALYAVGSLTAGLIFGALAIKASLVRQFMISVAALAVVTLPLPFLSTVWLVAVGLFVAGIACSPVLISGMALIERDRPGQPADRVDDLGDLRSRGRDRHGHPAGRRGHRHRTARRSRTG